MYDEPCQYYMCDEGIVGKNYINYVDIMRAIYDIIIHICDWYPSEGMVKVRILAHVKSLNFFDAFMK